VLCRHRRAHRAALGRFDSGSDKLLLGGAARNGDDVWMAAKRNRPSADTSKPIEWGDIRAQRIAFESGETIFRQGDPCRTILYVQAGSVRLSVVSHAGKEAVIAILEAGDFFGEGCLTGQPVRTATATAMSVCDLLQMQQQEVTRTLHSDQTFADSFVSHILKGNTRMEEDLIDQLFNSTEKRLARALLLLAQYGTSHGPRRALPKVSQEILAEMVGTTRPRVNFFMNRFRKLGFIEYDASGVKVNNSLVGVVLAE
jgi:CRP-like cAMP-binding protein